mmetsp:Transcript_4264/g.9165  ORF Transcript_4264/g.9165 Transcript_4264/m.9165 type:complete len:387 (-) Transcript_4264:1149-2309(-)
MRCSLSMMRSAITAADSCLAEAKSMPSNAARRRTSISAEPVKIPMTPRNPSRRSCRAMSEPRTEKLEPNTRFWSMMTTSASRCCARGTRLSERSSLPIATSQNDSISCRVSPMEPERSGSALRNVSKMSSCSRRHIAWSSRPMQTSGRVAVARGLRWRSLACRYEPSWRESLTTPSLSSKLLSSACNRSITVGTGWKLVSDVLLVLPSPLLTLVASPALPRLACSIAASPLTGAAAFDAEVWLREHGRLKRKLVRAVPPEGYMARWTSPPAFLAACATPASPMPSRNAESCRLMKPWRRMASHASWVRNGTPSALRLSMLTRSIRLLLESPSSTTAATRILVPGWRKRRALARASSSARRSTASSTVISSTFDLTCPSEPAICLSK